MIKDKIQEIEEKNNIKLGVDLPLVVIDHEYTELYSSMKNDNIYNLEEIKEVSNKIIKVEPVIWKPTKRQITVDERVVTIHRKIDGYRIMIDTVGN